MGICHDDATTYLRRLGYNVVRHPRAGIEPLNLIGVQDGATRYLGGLSQLITTAPGPLPQINRDEVASGIEGQASSKLSVAIGVSLLKSLASAFGGNVGADIGFQQAKTLQFVFSKVLSDSVAPLDIGNYLKSGVIDVGNLILEQYVLGNGRLYVISRTIKTSKFTVKAERSNSEAVGLDVPAIQVVASGKLKVDASAASSGTVSYEGDKDLVFGFECFEIGVVGGVLSLTSSKPGSVAMAVAPAPGPIEPAMLGIGNLLGLLDT